MEAIASAVGAKCGVDASRLVPAVCPHAAAAAAVPAPRAVRLLLQDSRRKLREAEMQYRREVLGQSDEEFKDVPPVPVLGGEGDRDGHPTGRCCECGIDIGKDGVVLLPGWREVCRRHARWEVLQRTPWGAASLCVVPRGHCTACWCVVCAAAIDVASVLPEAQHWLVPAVAQSAVAIAGEEERLCLTAAALAAEARSWHSFAASISPSAPPTSFLSRVRSLFLPPCGADAHPARLSSPWSRRLGQGMATGFAYLPHADVVDAETPEEQPEGEPLLGRIVLGEKKCIFGFLLTVDESDDAEGGGGEEGDGEELPEEVISRKVAQLTSLGTPFHLAVRYVYDTLHEKWVLAVVPHVSRTDEPFSTQQEYFVPPDQLPPESPHDYEDSEEEEEERDDTKEVSEWVKFFFDAHTIALGIIQVGAIMEGEESRRA